jgi:hypothetical protein
LFWYNLIFSSDRIGLNNFFNENIEFRPGYGRNALYSTNSHKQDKMGSLIRCCHMPWPIWWWFNVIDMTTLIFIYGVPEGIFTGVFTLYSTEPSHR